LYETVKTAVFAIHIASGWKYAVLSGLTEHDVYVYATAIA